MILCTGLWLNIRSCHINVIFQFPSCNKTGCDYARQAGDYFKGHPSHSLAFLLIVCDDRAVLGSAEWPVIGGRPMIVFIPHVGSGSTPLKGLSFLASYKMTSLAHISVQRG